MQRAFKFGGFIMAKMRKKWIALCSAALGAIYAAEYFATQSNASMESFPQYSQISAQIESSSAPSTPAPITPAPAPKPTPTPKPTPKPTPTPAPSLYKEGTFTGSGSNRRGSIQVTVTIKNDKITDVQISDFAMHYSISDVVGLPDEVLHNQNAQVDNVSGATYSTRAFEDAVQDALSQAQNT
jgi:uncharacterized protein with FMN-binding domain